MPDRRKFLKNSLLPLSAICLSTGLPAMAASHPKAIPGNGKENRSGPDGETGQKLAESPLSRKLKTINRNTVWNLIKTVRIQFKTFHCQGMVKIGNEFWVSSVEISSPVEGVWDRTKGKGHLFRIDGEGKLLADIPIGEGSIYHPSGIDFDGSHIWIAAAEYRPDSQAIIYKFDPERKELKEVFRWNDHIGGIARNKDTNTLHGISWGSRRFYQWDLDKEGNVSSSTLNHAFYIDYQDNQYLGGNEMLYTGLAGYKKPDGKGFALGGLEIVDLDKKSAVHQTPVQQWSPVTGAVMTQNPSFFEYTAEDKIRAYYMPDDNDSTLYVYELI
ncbi:DUF6454 family protein [Flavitalea flava]